MKKVLGALFISVWISGAGFGQLSSLHDTTITFKNQEGKVLTRHEVNELLKGVFSVREQVVDGKKIITIIPAGTDEKVIRQTKIDAFKNSLLNKPIGPFRLMDRNNKKWDSRDLRNKIIVINFWFTTCKPCILEIPHLNKLVAENQDSSVVFIAPAPENASQIKKFLNKYPFDYTIIPSSSDFITELNIENFPTHIVIGKDGIIRQVFIGYADDIKEKLQAEIDKLK